MLTMTLMAAVFNTQARLNLALRHTPARSHDATHAPAHADAHHGHARARAHHLLWLASAGLVGVDISALVRGAGVAGRGAPRVGGVLRPGQLLAVATDGGAGCAPELCTRALPPTEPCVRARVFAVRQLLHRRERAAAHDAAGQHRAAQDVVRRPLARCRHPRGFPPLVVSECGPPGRAMCATLCAPPFRPHAPFLPVESRSLPLIPPRDPQISRTRRAFARCG